MSQYRHWDIAEKKWTFWNIDHPNAEVFYRFPVEGVRIMRNIALGDGSKLVVGATDKEQVIFDYRLRQMIFEKVKFTLPPGATR